MPLEKGQAPLEKGQTYIEHFPAREDALLISESGCVHPEAMIFSQEKHYAKDTSLGLNAAYTPLLSIPILFTSYGKTLMHSAFSG